MNESCIMSNHRHSFLSKWIHNFLHLKKKDADDLEIKRSVTKVLVNDHFFIFTGILL